MPFFRRQRRLFALLALLAMGALALLPTLSHAIAWSNADLPWGAVCRVDGDARLQGSGPGEVEDHLTRHCPYCQLAGADLLPVAGPGSPPVPRPAEIRLACSWAGPMLATLWPRASPRGPPPTVLH